jgi:hypothetical protein
MRKLYKHKILIKKLNYIIENNSNIFVQLSNLQHSHIYLAMWPPYSVNTDLSEGPPENTSGSG